MSSWKKVEETFISVCTYLLKFHFILPQTKSDTSENLHFLGAIALSTFPIVILLIFGLNDPTMMLVRMKD